MMKELEQMLQNSSPLKRELARMLRNLCNDDEYVMGNLLYTNTDEEVQEVIQAIKDGDIVTADDASYYTLEIAAEKGYGEVKFAEDDD